VSGRQAQGARVLRVVEVVDVTPVIRDGPCGGLLPEETAHHTVFAAARRTEHIEVVARCFHAGAEMNRLHGAVLAKGFREAIEVFRGLEVKQVVIAVPVQFCGGQGLV
jgi:hypothetical protein